VNSLPYEFSMPKFDLEISPPLMNAAGSMGFVPETSGVIDFTQFGAFITNPISLHSRTPARSRSCLPYPGGFLLHSGYPNPGLRSAIRRFAQRWVRADLPIIVHLLVDSVDVVTQMVPQLEGLEGVMGIEIGLPPDIDPALACDLVQAAAGELPLIVRVPMERVGELSKALLGSPLTAISMAPPTGMLKDQHGSSVRGRLYGPTIFPLTLRNAHEAVDFGIPLIAAGGVYEPSQAEVLIEAGAIGVQLDAVLWNLGWREKRDSEP
jgi:dihydroorotate dehydrogenase (NAD+) catalytic subunit